MPELTLYYKGLAGSFDAEFLKEALITYRGQVEIHLPGDTDGHEALIHRVGFAENAPICNVSYELVSEFTDADWEFHEDDAEEIRQFDGYVYLEWDTSVSPDEQRALYAIVEKLKREASHVLERGDVGFGFPPSWKQFQNLHKRGWFL